MKYISEQDIQRKLQWVLNAPSDYGRVDMLVIRPHTNQRKLLDHALFTPEGGVTGDNWRHNCWKKLASGHSDPDVQVAIMNSRMIEALTEDKSLWPLAGDQLFVDFNLSESNLSAGDQLEIGEVKLEITAEPHRGCQKFKQRFGDAALRCVNSTQGDAHRLRGVYAKIVSSGEVRTGDVIRKQ